MPEQTNDDRLTAIRARLEALQTNDALDFIMARKDWDRNLQDDVRWLVGEVERLRDELEKFYDQSP